MKTPNRFLVVFLLLFAISTISFTQEDQPPVGVAVTKLTDKIYQLTCFTTFSVNLIASVGEDGILLVDAGFANTADSLYAAVKELGDGNIKYLINTHVHSDHVGGNDVFADEAVIIAHENTRNRMSGDFYALPGTPPKGIPDSVFTDEMSLQFNGEEIKLKYMPNAHTDGDIIVYFTDSIETLVHLEVHPQVADRVPRTGIDVSIAV